MSAGRPKFKKQIMTLEDLLSIRIKNNKNAETKKKFKEANMTKKLFLDLYDILTLLNYNVKTISKEFRLMYGICDFLCELENGEYLIIECKTHCSNTYDNNNLRFSFATGQLLTYRTVLSMQYRIDKEKIKLMLITDEDSLLTLDVINTENLNIDYLVYNEEGVKYYGKNGQTKSNYK